MPLSQTKITISQDNHMESANLDFQIHYLKTIMEQLDKEGQMELSYLQIKISTEILALKELIKFRIAQIKLEIM